MTNEKGCNSCNDEVKILLIQRMIKAKKYFIHQHVRAEYAVKQLIYKEIISELDHVLECDN